MTNIGSAVFPMEYTLTCELITNCAKSYTANICEECEPGYVLSNSTTCTLITGDANFLDKFEFCNEFIDPNAAIILCKKCKDGYVETDKCVPYIVDGCSYYDGSNCVQANVTMGVNFSILYKKESEEYKIKQPNCDQSGLNLIQNCRFYDENKNCMICEDNYFIGANSTECYLRDVSNCVEYDDVNKVCTKCANTFSLSVDSITKIGTCVTAAQTPSVYGCSEYFQGYCVKCSQTNYIPIKINLEKSSLCIDAAISRLCDEIDEEELVNNKILTCKKCKTLTQIKTEVNSSVIKLDQFDFLSSSDFNSSVISEAINYSTIINDFPYIRAALFKKNLQKWCKTYEGVVNCKSHDVHPLIKLLDVWNVNMIIT